MDQIDYAKVLVSRHGPPLLRFEHWKIVRGRRAQHLWGVKIIRVKMFIGWNRWEPTAKRVIKPEEK